MRTRGRNARGRVMAGALAMAGVSLLAACSSATSTSSAHATTSTVTTTVPPRAFADALASGNTAVLSTIFAENASFYTPVLPNPIVGHDHVVKLATVLLATFKDPKITAELQSPGHFALAFDAHIGDQPISIFDLITFDGSGRIITFVSHGRPLAGVQALATAVRPHLADILS